MFPLIWGGDATNYSANSISLISRYCFPGDLDSHKVEGRIVLCEARSDGSGVVIGKGVGIIMPRPSGATYAPAFSVPASLISEEEISQVLDYIKSVK